MYYVEALCKLVACLDVALCRPEFPRHGVSRAAIECYADDSTTLYL